MTENEKRKVLKVILKKEKMTRADVEKFCKQKLHLDDCRILLYPYVWEDCKLNEIGCSTELPTDIFTVSDKGKDYLDEYKKRFFEKRLPVIVSICALIIALGSLILSFIALQQQPLTTQLIPQAISSLVSI